MHFRLENLKSFITNLKSLNEKKTLKIGLIANPIKFKCDYVSIYVLVILLNKFNWLCHHHCILLEDGYKIFKQLIGLVNPHQFYYWTCGGGLKFKFVICIVVVQ